MFSISVTDNEDVIAAGYALKQANSGNIISLCENYLLKLNNYREELHKFCGSPAALPVQDSPLANEINDKTRKAIRTAIEGITAKRNETEFLLRSFKEISGYEAVRTFNKLEYKGFHEWELRANQVRLLDDNNGNKFTIEEAVEIAGKLRRTAYVLYKTVFFEEVK